MLAKLLKYDMRSVARVWWIAAISVLGLSTVGAFALRFVISYADKEDALLLVLMGVLVFIASIFAVIASVILTELLVYWRFYKHLFTDEGYLTFTLPVSRKQLLFSKTLNALIWMALEGVLVLVCILIFCTFAPPADGGLINWIVFETIGTLLSSLNWAELGAWPVVYVLLGLLMLFASQFLGISIVHLCITIGSVITKKAKLLVGIAIYYGFNMVLSFLGQMSVYIITMVVGFGLESIMTAASFGMTQTIMTLMLLIATLIISSIAALLYCITQGLLERKLNLA